MPILPLFTSSFTGPFTLPYPAFVGATLLLALFLGYTAWRTAVLLRTWRPAQNPMLSTPENALRLILVGICIALGAIADVDAARLGWTFTDLPGQALRGTLWGLGLAFLFGFLTRSLIARTGRRFYSPLVLELILPKSHHEFFLLAFAMIPAVLLEELLYRSLLIGGLTPLVPSAVLIVVVGVVFGLLHTPQGTWGTLGATLAGILFGWLFVREGSLVLPVVAHYVANLAQIAWAYRYPEVTEAAPEAD